MDLYYTTMGLFQAFLFIFCVYHSDLISAEMNVSNFKISKIYNTQYGQELGTTTAPNQLWCISQCSLQPSCRSATFDEASKSCRTNQWSADVSIICDLSAGCSDSNTLQYAAKYPLTTMRQACSSDAECVDPSSLCILDQCQCEPGYSYNGTSFACVTSCSSYGTTFQTDIGRKILQFGQDVFNNVSLDECKSACFGEASYVCRTFEYKSSVGKCILQEATALSQPGAYADSPEKDLYTRDCEY